MDSIRFEYVVGQDKASTGHINAAATSPSPSSTKGGSATGATDGLVRFDYDVVQGSTAGSHIDAAARRRSPRETAKASACTAVTPARDIARDRVVIERQASSLR